MLEAQWMEGLLLSPISVRLDCVNVNHILFAQSVAHDADE